MFLVNQINKWLGYLSIKEEIHNYFLGYKTKKVCFYLYTKMSIKIHYVLKFIKQLNRVLGGLYFFKKIQNFLSLSNTFYSVFFLFHFLPPFFNSIK